MESWPKNPLIYEINTRVWLVELSRRDQCERDLSSVPDAEWDQIADLGFDAVWLMGVWERSPEGIRISMTNDSLLNEFHRALPDFTDQDNVGSPYCVRRYAVDAHLGGTDGLSIAREKLSRRGLQLILDFVPNHVAPDHPWVHEHPGYFIHGNAQDLQENPGSFVSIGDRIFACGRDPFFPAWPDVLQLNAFDRGLRAAAIETLDSIARQCDGVRCDMAMLMMNPVFERTWGSRAESMPKTDYWPEIIPVIREKYPEFRFIAEAYWNLEWELQLQGFDYCYDKRLYDRLAHNPAADVRLHLCADPAYQKKLVRFIENHDEPRAAATFTPRKHRAVAVTALTLPGARLIHEGQIQGRRVRLPVFLSRRPEESPDPELAAFYQKLLEALRRGNFLQGVWRLCEQTGWPDNGTGVNLVSWFWRNGPSRCLVVVNLSDSPSQALIRIPRDDGIGKTCHLKDVFTDDIYERDGEEICSRGLYVDLPAWGYHFLEF
ncbi:MAG: alpha-amylase family glycosyl hydrolase [Desulfatirhabdiaceae bacterium]